LRNLKRPIHKENKENYAKQRWKQEENLQLVQCLKLKRQQYALRVSIPAWWAQAVSAKITPDWLPLTELEIKTFFS